MSIEWSANLQALPGDPNAMKFVGVLRIVGTSGHCVAPDGRRLPQVPQVQELMNRVASLYSKIIREQN